MRISAVALKTLAEKRGILDYEKCIVSRYDRVWVEADESHPSFPSMRARSSRPAVSSGGAGTELKKLLAKIGIQSSAGCACNSRAALMDKNGISWCEQNVELICDWLQEEATKRKLPFVRVAGKALIHLAIRRAKKATSK